MNTYSDRVKSEMSQLAETMAKLRAPGGCPWDREQTMDSLKPYLIEEAYEVLEAIESGDQADHREELGDLLMQVVFQAEIAREQGHFDLADVARTISDKLIRRHPHVFGDVAVANSQDVVNNWEKLKKAEKNGRPALAGVPRAMPGLIRALRTGEKAAAAGFDFDHVDQAFAKIEEEIAELRSASPEERRGELGDLLFAVVNVARLLSLDPEEALRESIDRFSARFTWVEKAADGGLKEMTSQQKEALWREAKRETK